MVPASSRTQPPHRRRRSTGAVGVLRILVAMLARTFAAMDASAETLWPLLSNSRMQAA